jgi:hypothetical protein
MFYAVFGVQSHSTFFFWSGLPDWKFHITSLAASHEGESCGKPQHSKESSSYK